MSKKHANLIIAIAVQGKHRKKYANGGQVGLDVIKKEKYAKGGVMGLRGAKKGHTLKQLKDLESKDWYNRETGYEMSQEEGEHRLRELQQNKADRYEKSYGSKMSKLPKKHEPEEPMLSKGGKIGEHVGEAGNLLSKSGEKINKKSEQKRIFGKDANGDRISPERMKMMNLAKEHVKKEYGVGLRTAAGKRTPSGEIRDEGVQEPYDVYTPEGHEKEKKYAAHLKSKGQKRIDPKPDWENPDDMMDSQPSPDAVVHEITHARQTEIGDSLGKHQDKMDALQGKVQKKYGFLQNKRTSHEIQPMAMENPLRRELGFPANKSVAKPMTKEELAKHNAGRIKNKQPPLETNKEGITLTHDTKEPMYVKGKDQKGRDAYYMRQSRLMSPENRERTEAMRDKTIKYNPDKKEMVHSKSGNALINLRGQGRHEEAKERLKNRGEDRFAQGGMVNGKENYSVAEQVFHKLKAKAKRG